MDFETQIKFFTEQLTELIEGAREQAAQDFNDERYNWEQTERSFLATVREMEIQVEGLKAERDDAKSALYDLKDRLSGLM